MDFRQLGGAGFRVPVLSLGTSTFGGVLSHQRSFAKSSKTTIDGLPTGA